MLGLPVRLYQRIWGSAFFYEAFNGARYRTKSHVTVFTSDASAPSFASSASTSLSEEKSFASSIPFELSLEHPRSTGDLLCCLAL